ncbi:MAG: MBL fold metallo-hydrolase [Deltaproteobacteria bacterium]|nr:MBL fold metallo-hydrolase [Deltaproteobacteria bacterium]MBW2154315.1 MBL fold metallo-hydrolase [Deltaproteobacteria bacterium]
MYIKCWGSRGSTPVSGKNYLKYGGDTTCVEIRTKENDIIIVDAGTGIRRLGNQLVAEGIFRYHFIFTHAHWDHLMGFPFFKPLYFRKAELQMHRCPFHSKFVETVLSKVMAPPNFPVKYSNVKAKISYEPACPETFQIGSIMVTPIPLSHPNGGSGYKFEEDGKSFVFLTDNELGYVHPGGASRSEYLDFSAGADLLIHDGEYNDEEYEKHIEWGHSTYMDALDLALKAGAKKLGLFHINQERFDLEMDMIVEHCHHIINSKGQELDCFAVSGDMSFML